MKNLSEKTGWVGFFMLFVSFVCLFVCLFVVLVSFFF